MKIKFKVRAYLFEAHKDNITFNTSSRRVEVLIDRRSKHHKTLVQQIMEVHLEMKDDLMEVHAGQEGAQG